MPDNTPLSPQAQLNTLASLSVVDSEGDARVLGTLWANQKAVLVFLPPLRSKSAKDRAAEAAAYLKALRSRGAEVYLIGPSFPGTAGQFEDAQPTGCELYVDTECHALFWFSVKRTPTG